MNINPITKDLFYMIVILLRSLKIPKGVGDLVAQWVRSLDLTAHTSLSPIRHGFAPSFVNYKKGCTRLAAASDKVYQLLAQARWFSPGTPASSTTKTGRHDIAEILLKVALKHQKSKSIQRGNQNPYIEEEQTTQWPKGKVEKDKQWFIKHTYKTKDIVTRAPLKNGDELMCSGMVSSSCATSDIRRVNLVTNPVISHERGKDREMFTTSGTYPWIFPTFF